MNGLEREWKWKENFDWKYYQNLGTGNEGNKSIRELEGKGTGIKGFRSQEQGAHPAKTAKKYKNTCSPQCLYLANYGINIAKMAYLCQKSINPSINCSYFGAKNSGVPMCVTNCLQS